MTSSNLFSPVSQAESEDESGLLCSSTIARDFSCAESPNASWEHLGSSNGSAHPNSRLDLLRKRQVAANRAAARSTLVAATEHRSRERELDDEEEWLSDEPFHDQRKQVSSASTCQVWKMSPRTHRRSQSHGIDSPFSTPVRLSSKFVTGHSAKRSLGRSDQRWISLLERNNEELMTQISTLASDLTETEKHLKLRLKTAEEEVRLLSEQLLERDRANKKASDQYRREVSSLRSRILDDNKRLSEAVAHVTHLETQAKVLARERDLASMRLVKRDEEILRIKRRNAELAEQSLNQRTLEMYVLCHSAGTITYSFRTVEGQNRWLSELSTALDETKRMGGSEPSLSPRFGTPPDAHSGYHATSFFPAGAGERTNERPQSFDGTRWSQYMHNAQSLSPPATSHCGNRPCTASSTQHSTEPPSPPLTDRESSPTLERSDFQSDSRASSLGRASALTRSLEFRQGPDLHRKRRLSKTRISPLSNDTSLWAELCDSELQPSMVAIDNSEHTGQHHPCLTKPAIGLNHLSEYAVIIRGSTIASSLRVVYLWYNWLRFLALLVAAVALIIVEGPDSISAAPRTRMNNILSAESFGTSPH